MDVETVVIGAGQAGLAVSRELTRAGVDHVVLEQGRVGQTWRGRWDSFCLVTPNWSVRLPGLAYDGAHPDGFMPRDEVVGYLERYAAGVAPPVHEGVKATSVTRSNGRFRVQTSAGPLTARAVVAATGAYQRSHRPAAAQELPRGLLQLDVDDYRGPNELPAGPVLVVGSGQSGCQIAEELHEAGRNVFLACGRAPWAPRRLGGHDLFWWLDASGELDQPTRALPGPDARLIANVQASGRHGGHDLHYRTLQKLGVVLIGHFIGCDGHRARFADDLESSVAWADERHSKLMNTFRAFAADRALPAPEIVEPEPFRATGPEELDLRGFGAVLFAGGFRPDYSSWIRLREAFDPLGFPIHEDGASTVVPGLYFVGVHYLRKRKSSLLIGVGEDAAIVARKIGDDAGR